MTNQEINEAVAKRLGLVKTPAYFRQQFRYERPNGTFSWDLPNYCTDISAAWEIVKYVSNKLDPNGDVKKTSYPCGRMRFRGHGFRLEHHTEDTMEKWICTLPEIVCAPPYEEMNDDIQAEADTAPMALCLAFLKLPTRVTL